MTIDAVTYRPIGLIHSPHTELEQMPVQPAGARGVKGRLVLDSHFQDGLEDLEGFSHIIIIYHLHRSDGFSLRVTPFLDTSERGLFSTRAPRRPNPIGLSVVRLESVEGAVVHVADLDVLDGTPLLDIKPFVAEFDAPRNVRTGWLADRSSDARNLRSDNRFSRKE